MEAWTTLQKLGLGELVKRKDIEAIREWFSKQDPEEHARRIFELAGVKYVVMTNIPFLPSESSKWIAGPGKLDAPLEQTFDRYMFRTALRDWIRSSAVIGVRSRHACAKQISRSHLKVQSII